MALYLNGTLLANVELTNTFNVWRQRTNEIIEAAAGLGANNVYTANNTFNGDITTFANTVTFSNTVNFTGPSSLTLSGANTVVGGNVTMTTAKLIGNKTVGGVMTINHLVANTITANGANATGAGQILLSNSIGGMYWGTGDFGTDTTVSDDTSTNATRYILFYDQTSGDVTGVNVASTKLTFNPSSGKLTTTSYEGEITTASQQNITSLGTQTQFKISGGFYAGSPLSTGSSGQVLTSTGSGVEWNDVLPSGTVMLFVQTAAPTGWTKSTTHNNKALRVVDGTVSTGGSQPFSGAFTSQAVTGTTDGTAAPIASASVPLQAHSHGPTGGSVGPQYPGTYTYFVQPGGANFSSTNNYGGGRNPPGSTLKGYGDTTWGESKTNSSTYGNSSVNTAGSGNGSHSHSSPAHTHTFTGTAIDLAVEYVDVIIATKD